MANLRLRAINVVQRTKKPGTAADPSKGIKAVAPVVEELKPGTIFNASDKEQFKELTSGVYPAAAAAPVDDDDDDQAGTDVSKMKKAELVAYAEENELEVDTSAKVDDLRAAIIAAEAGEGPEGPEGGEGGEGGDGTDLV